MPEYCAMALSTARQETPEAQQMTVIGITGGMGAGKSVVSGILATLGHVVYDADAAAKFLYDHDGTLLRAVVERFGPGILDEGGRLHRKALAEVVFHDSVALAALNALVHPAVSRDFEAWKRRQQQAGRSVVFREAAILFESGSHATCDEVWAVTAPVALRVERCRQRTSGSEAEILKRMRQQWPAEKVNAQAHHVLLNDGSCALVPLVIDLVSKI
jgi:dephospho-CoA kinase